LTWHEVRQQVQDDDSEKWDQVVSRDHLTMQWGKLLLPDSTGKDMAKK
jgi:hypothetical protein